MLAERAPSHFRPSPTLRRYYAALLARFGPQGWWPARTRLEVILGAILTQNTAWSNAARAIARLRRAGLLNLRKLRGASQADLEICIRPAGFYRQKAAAIRSFLEWLDRTCGGSLHKAFLRPPELLRKELLGLRGLGPETADAILLYAGGKPFFVADAYTRRVLARHAMVSPRAGYAAVQEFVHRSLPPDPEMFNEFHALLVEVGKRCCRRRQALCGECPLKGFLPPEARVNVQDAAALTSPAAP
ncbi:MAG: endonuclease III domain-containing protein [Acidobacteriia bacterium]|nr:endonuclease III domain-containing protein [Terriglobia bacterium]